MLTHLADASIRSLFLIALADAALLAIRKRSSPALRHAIWTAVVLGMLALFAIGETLPHLQLRILNPAPQQNDITETTTTSESFTPIESSAEPMPTRAPHSTTDWTALTTDLYAIVAAALAIRFFLGVLLVRRLLAKSTPAEGFRESELIGIPVTAGWLRPVIVLPTEWREWNEAKLATVLTHERAHVRRKDGLIALIAGLNRCLFWFNPLAWWLERRLALLAEQACDEATILTLGGGDENREAYVNLLLDMAAHIRTPQGRLRNHVLAMASHSQIRRRIEPLLNQRRVFSRGLTTAAFAALIVCGIPMVWATGSIDIAHQSAQLHLDVSQFAIAIPRVPEQHPQFLAQSTPTQRLEALPSFTPTESANPHDAVVVHGTVSFGLPQAKPNRIAQSQPPTAPPSAALPQTFEVASIRENPGPWHVIHGYSSSGPRLNLEAWSVAAIVQEAYGLKSYQVIYTPPSMVLYNIAAKAEGDAPLTREQFQPLLQHLLATRFAIKFHRETRDIPVYVMVIGKNGEKFKESDPDEPAKGYGGVYGRNQSVELQQGTMEQLAESIPGDVLADRPVIDKTGLTGKYDIRLEATPYMRINNNPQPDDLSIFDAIQQQLGLKLEAQKLPMEVIVVDHLESPTEN